MERDFNSLWNTGYFENVRIERVDTPTCVQLIVYVKEKPTIRELNYKGLNAVTLSDVQERYKKDKVGVTVESQYDPTRIKRAEQAIKDLLAEHGHQFATVKTEVKTIPPAAAAVTFNIKEGPTVKVGKIAFDGNTALSDRVLIESMKNLKPIGVPHSIFLENLLPRTFDASKLDEDAERVRYAYRDRGYFKALTGEPKTRVRDTSTFNPLTFRPSIGKKIDILIPVEEGERYRLGGITFKGNTHIPNTRVLRAQFAIKDGDYFNASLFGKGLEQLRKAYGQSGYINFVGSPVPRFDEAKKLIYLDIDIDEGKQFYVSRIEFQGNTITRDKVIRRELLVDEGSVYNSQLIDLSLLRLNQLNYFENLKAETDLETRQNADDGTVDLLLKLKEKGKNSIGLNGGISGLSGTFIGLNYETNNFLGLGETLSVQANVGDLSRNLSLGFTEPYLRNKPISLGVSVFTQKYDYNPAKAYGAQSGASQNQINAISSQTTNYNTTTTGATVSISEPLRHLFATKGVARIGASYSLSRSSVSTFNTNTRNVFQSLAFRSGVSGQNQLNGIVTSVITPTFNLSSLDRSQGPHNGKDLNIQLQVAGAGGNVKYFSPAIAYRQFFPFKGLRENREGHNVLGYRIQVAHVNGFGGEVAPPTSRIYGGGESDVRGFDIRASSPYVFVPTRVDFNLTNPGGATVPRDPSNPSLGTVTVPAARLPAGFDRRRHADHVQYRVPDPDRQPGYFRVLQRLRPDLQHAQQPVEAVCLRPVDDREPVLRLPAVGQRGVLRGHAGQVQPVSEHGARDELRAARLARCRAAGDPADRECAVPDLLRVQPAASVQEPAAATGAAEHRACRNGYVREPVPDQHRCGPELLLAGAAVLRRGLRAARAPQDAAPDGQHHLLKDAGLLVVIPRGSAVAVAVANLATHHRLTDWEPLPAPPEAVS